MIKHLLICGIVATTALTSWSSSAFTESPHTIGLAFGAGSAKFKGSTQDGDGVVQTYLFYNFQMDESTSFEIGSLGGNDADYWECDEINDDEWSCKENNEPIFNIGADELKYNQLVLAAKHSFHLTQNSQLFGKLGINFYDYEFERKNKVIAEDSGTGLHLEAGWQYQWDSGWSATASYLHSNMDDLKISTLNMAVSYSF